MSDDHQSSGDAGARRRPPPPTIDLTASQVPGSATGVGNTEPQPGSTPESPPEATQGASSAVEPNTGSPAPESAPPDDAPGETRDAEPPPSDEASTAPRRERGRFAALVGGVPWSALGGGIAGALMVLLIASGLRSAFVTRTDEESEERMARLESQVKQLAGRPAPAGVAQKPLDDLAARVARLEQAPPRRPEPAIDNRISALEAGTKALGDGIANLNRRADETAATLRELRDQFETAAKSGADAARPAVAPSEVSRADLDQLKERLAALDPGQRMAALETTIASIKDALSKATEPDRATRLALLAFALDTAVARGVPYEAELAGVRALAGDPKLVEPLQPFATRGVPGLNALAGELAALAPKLPGPPPAAAPPSSGILERLQANAERLVRVRPVNEAPSDEPAAVVARMQAKVAQGDVAGAIADAAKLPADARAVVNGWTQRAAARQAAIAAARHLSANSLAALGRGATQGGPQK